MTFAFPPQSATHDAPSNRRRAVAPAMHTAWTRTRRLQSALTLICVGVLGGLSGCSTIEQIPIPFVTKRGPDLTNGRASAENMVRLDAQLRSGCDVVDNITRPSAKADPRNPAPQQWVARTCHGDITYDVTTVPGKDGPTIKVTPVPGPIDRPMNTHFIPAGLDGASTPPDASDSGATPSATPEQPAPSQSK
jgi:hypothetical protein